MRLLLVSACVTALTTAPALACPRQVLCIVQPDTAASAEVARTQQPISLPDVRAIQTIAPVPMDFGDAPKRLAPGEIELPWIWQVIREQYDANVPKYETPERFSLALSPVVVASPSWDPIPGVGIAGSF